MKRGVVLGVLLLAATVAGGCGGSKAAYDVDEVRDALVAKQVAFGELLDFRNGPVERNGSLLRPAQGVLASSDGGLVRLQVMDSDKRAEEIADFWSALADPGFITHQGNVAVQVSPPQKTQVTRVKAALQALDD